MTDVAPPITASPAPRPKRSPLRLLATVIALAAAGGMVGRLLGTWMRGPGPRPSGGLGLDGAEKLGLIVVCVVLVHLMLLAHEVGHLVGGRLVGFRAFLLIVGPLRLERGANGWSMHLNRSAALWGGLAGSAPTDGVNLRQRSAVMIAAGPLTSVVSAFIALVLWWSVKPAALDAATPYADVLLAFGLLIFAVTSACIGAATLIPMSTSGFLSDGARLLRLLRGGPVTQRDIALQQVMAQTMAGVRPRDWNHDLIAEALTVRDGSLFEFTTWQFALYHALDHGRTDEAMTWLARSVASVDWVPPTMQPAVRYEAARLLALHGDLGAARAQFAMARGPAPGAPYARPLAEATLLAVDGRRDEALALLPDVRRHLLDNVDRGSARLMLDAVDAIERGEVPTRTA